ncbi:hypothetical protein WDU94_002867 [Cyamophila willieti]
MCEQSAEDLEIELEKWKNALEKRGLRINRTKTVQLNFGMDEGQRVHLDGEELNVVDKFKYLESMIDKEGELDCEIAHRVAAAWLNWKRITGVLCDKKMNLKMKGKVYKTVKRLEVAEMRMLRWSCGVTRLDRIRNEVIRNKMKVTEVSKKIQERRLQWHGHVERRDENYIGKRVERMVVRGRPKKRWKNCVNQDLHEKNLSGT